MSDTHHASSRGVPPAPSDAELERRVRAGLIRTHLENNRVVLPAAFVVNTVVVVLLADALPDATPLMLWWLALNTLNAWRLWHLRRLQRARDADRFASGLYRTVIIEAALSGLLWGLVGTAFYPPAESHLQNLSVLVIMGVSASGLVSLAPVLPAYVAFFGLMLLPPALGFALRDSLPEQVTALTLVLLAIALLMNGIRVNRNLRHNLRLTAELETALRREAQARIAADAANEAKSRFLAAMGHEIRTPMNGVLGMAQLLARTPLDARQQRCLKTLDDAGHQLLGLIDDVLDFTKVESGQLTTHAAPLDVRALCDELLAALKPRADERHLALLSNIADEVPGWIEADPQRLRQILANLLNNAVKFTHQGGVTLSVACRGEAHEDTPRIEFAVIDTGEGMSPHEQTHVFRAFAQGDGSPTRGAGGIGLGLTIARDLARLMGGELVCQSVSGVGTTFRLQLPLRVPPAAPVPAAGDHDPAHWHLSGHVLVVEDSDTNREVAALTLQALGLALDTAADGQEAIDRLRERRYDAVLMDCQLPGMDGYDTTRELRRLERSLGWSRTPVIALTADAATDNEARCHAAGMDDFIVKPFDIDNLAATFARWLPRKPRLVS